VLIYGRTVSKRYDDEVAGACCSATTRSRSWKAAWRLGRERLCGDAMKWPGWLTASINHPVVGLLLRVYVAGVHLCQHVQDQLPRRVRRNHRELPAGAVLGGEPHGLVMPGASWSAAFCWFRCSHQICGSRDWRPSGALQPGDPDHPVARHPHRLRCFTSVEEPLGWTRWRRPALARHGAAGLFFPIRPAAGRPRF